MRVIFHIGILILLIVATDSSIYSNFKSSLSKYLGGSIKAIKQSLRNDASKDTEAAPDTAAPSSRFKIKYNSISDEEVRKDGKEPKAIIRIFKAREADDKYTERDKKSPKKFPVNIENKPQPRSKPYILDPVLNSFRKKNDFRRNSKKLDTSSSDSQSSSLELREWKNEWKEYWVKKKLQALNDTIPQGDVVNMVAARPWGVACGDPNQHDMPWGTCMMAMECEPEYRIYRGDFQCGRTNFVCCALQLTNYDMYQGFDVSFDDSSLTTDSEEKKRRGKSSKEIKRKKKERERKRRKKDRIKRKKKIKKNIKKIIKEMKKIMNRQYRNGTTQRKKKTKQLKKFVKDLKKKYKEDRKSVQNIHEIELVKIDSKLLNKLKEIKMMNKDFVSNATFRSIIVNGTINREGARMLVEAYPELIPYFTDKTRRTGDGGNRKESEYGDFDVEYGMLYY